MVLVVCSAPGHSTRCVEVEGTLDHFLQTEVSSETSVRCLVNGKESDSTTVLHHMDSVLILPRLTGGKGGFGSMLRAIGAQIEATTNNDACRDLSGKRLRDVKCEKLLQEWAENQAKEKVDKVDRKRQRLQRVLDGPSRMKSEDNTYISEMRDMSGSVEDAIAKAVALDPNVVHPPPPPPKKWFGDSDSSDDEEAGSSGEQSDPGEETKEEEEVRGEIRITFDDDMPEEQMETVDVIDIPEDAPAVIDIPELPPAVIDIPEDPVLPPADPLTPPKSPQLPPPQLETPSPEPTEALPTFPTVSDPVPTFPTEPTPAVPTEPTPVFAIEPVIPAEPTPPSPERPPRITTIDLNNYPSSDSLLSLGADNLKHILSERGLKCGGTIQQRADRLYSVKGLSKDHISKELLATAGKGRKRKVQS